MNNTTQTNTPTEQAIANRAKLLQRLLTTWPWQELLDYQTELLADIDRAEKHEAKHGPNALLRSWKSDLRTVEAEMNRRSDGFPS